MIVIPTKERFPLLPFNHDIEYLTLCSKQEKAQILDLPLSSETSEPETESTNFNDSAAALNNIKYLQKKKNSVKMNEKAENFKYSFYHIFTQRKKFPKKIVIDIHNLICGELNLRRIQRDECRSIFLYFAHFADKSDIILAYLRQNKENIIQRISSLQNILQ